MSTELQKVMKQLKKTLLFTDDRDRMAASLGASWVTSDFATFLFFGQFKYVFIINLFL